MISTTKFNELYQQRLDAYNSYDLIIDNIPAGHGRTTQWTQILANNNLNNIILTNNHFLQFEIIKNINDGIIKAPGDAFINDLYGKTYLMPEEIQKELNSMTITDPSRFYTDCFCDLYNPHDTFLFNQYLKGCLPHTWCENENLCPYSEGCSHKYLFKSAWNNARSGWRYHSPVMWLPPKAYNNNSESGVISGIIKNYAKSSENHNRNYNLDNFYKKDLKILFPNQTTNMFYDENPVNYIYDEFKLSRWQLNRFKEIVSKKILPLNKGNTLFELWKDLLTIVDSLINNIMLISIPEKKKKEDFEKNVKDFYDCYKGQDLLHWDNKLRYLIYKNKIPMNVSNPILTLYTIISDIYKHRNENKMYCMFTKQQEGESNSFSYYIDNRAIIRNNIKKCGTFILGSGFEYIEELFNTIYPEFNDYAILKLPGYHPPFKSYFRYTSGSYPKYVLYRNRKFTPQFYKLAKLCKDIMDLPQFRNEKILVIMFQRGIKELVKNYLPIEKYPHIQYEYWYNVEGKNAYLDCNVVILFGKSGRPAQFDKIIMDMFGLSRKLVLNLSIHSEMGQGIIRLRPNLLPHSKIGIGLTKTLPSGIENSVDFNNADDIALIPYLMDKKRATAEEIRNEVYKNELNDRRIRERLQKLEETGLIKSEQIDNFSPKTYSLLKEFKK